MIANTFNIDALKLVQSAQYRKEKNMARVLYNIFIKTPSPSKR